MSRKQQQGFTGANIRAALKAMKEFLDAGPDCWPREQVEKENLMELLAYSFAANLAMNKAERRWN